MSRIRLLTGRANAGQSAYIGRQLQQHMQRGEHAVCIVPEQYTFEAEKQLTDRFDGLLGVEVYSFTRLCERILERAGQARPFLSRQGRCMVIRRAAFRRQKELLLFGQVARHNGFAERMDALISQMKQSCIRPEDLETALSRADEGTLLYRKLHDVHALYADSEAFLSERFLTAGDMQSAVLDILPDSFLKGCHVYIDGLSNPSHQLFRLLEGIVRTAASVTIALYDGGMDAEDASLFAPDRRTAGRLEQIAAHLGAAYSVVPMTTPSSAAASALSHLEQNLFSPRTPVFDGDAGETLIFTASDRAAEAEMAADLVLDLARQGVRYRDIAIVVTDMDAYGAKLRRAFAKRDIPLFYDAKRPVLGHAAIDVMLAAVRFVTEGFSISCFLRIVKSGYAPCAAYDAEILENYILRYGLYGSALAEPFVFGEIPPEAERVRAALMPPLLRLSEALHTPEAAEKVKAVYAYLLALGLREQLQQEAQTLMADGVAANAELYRQVWDTVCDMLSQLHAILGDTHLSRKEFMQMLEEGAAGYQIGVVPGFADQVLLGDVARTRSRTVDTLIVLGCNEGLLPRTRGDDDILNDAELSSMEAWGLSVWNDTRTQAENDRLELYELLTRAGRRLYFGYAFSDAGTEMAPSPLIDRILTLLPRCRQQTEQTLAGAFPSCQRTGYERLITQLRLYRQDGVTAPLLPALLAYYRKHPLYRDALQAVLDERMTGTQPKAFPPALARAMYGQSPSMSATRLELFNGCAFSHYLKYGLSAKERPEAHERAVDTGTFIHEALDAFSRLVTERSLDWRALAEPDVDDLLRVCLPPLMATHHDGILVHNVRLREALFLQISLIKLSILTIIRQISAGQFTPMQTELSFGRDSAFPPLTLDLSDGQQIHIYGKIDRVDRTPDGLFRIVDYKLGSRKFEPGGIQNGIALQLPLYLAAAAGLGGDGVGMYYMPLSVPSAEPGKENRQLLTGVTVGDDDVIHATEPQLLGVSSLIGKLERGKDDSLSGLLCSREELWRIVDLARSVAADTARRMMRGEAGIHPTDKACTYCPYLAVCRFDAQLPQFRKRKLPTLSLDELLGKGDGV